MCLSSLPGKFTSDIQEIVTRTPNVIRDYGMTIKVLNLFSYFN